MGIAEQDMIATAAGLALTGKDTFCRDLRRVFAGQMLGQIRVSVCYSNLNVKFASAQAGFLWELTAQHTRRLKTLLL